MRCHHHHVVCVQDGSVFFFATTSLCRTISTWSPSTTALFSSTRDTFVPRHTCVQLFMPCKREYSTWAVEGMIVTGRFRRAPDKSCSYFTVANIHINEECARRRSICIARLLLIRDLCMKLGAVVLTGDFNKAIERETPSGDGERRTSLPKNRGILYPITRVSWRLLFQCGSWVFPYWRLLSSSHWYSWRRSWRNQGCQVSVISSLITPLLRRFLSCCLSHKRLFIFIIRGNGAIRLHKMSVFFVSMHVLCSSWI